MRRHVLIFASLSLPLSACLAETRQSSDSDVADTQADIDATHDTSDTSPDGDTTDLCLEVDCDDQNECTYDYCDPSTGACQYIGYPEPGPPTEPADPAVPMPPCEANCDDGDPCTTDLCEFVPDSCGLSGSYTCVHIPANSTGCGACERGCDDSDPCTVDTCTDNTCTYIPIEGCLAGCTAAGSLTIDEVIAQGPAEMVKTVGTLTSHPLYQSCDDGPECGCLGYPGLAGENQQLLLDAPGDFTMDTWGCRSTGCATPRTTCQPAQLGVRYRVWGRSMSEWEVVRGGQGTAIAPMQIGAIAVTDFCLETTARALGGTYTGTWEHNGFSASIKATIKETPTLEVTEVLCPANQGCPHGGLTLSLPLEIGDGYVDIITAGAPLPMGGAPVRLYSQRNSLTGSYGYGFVPFNGDAAAVAPLYGTVTLDRVAPTDVSGQP
jgi:hypothetical protein